MAKPRPKNPVSMNENRRMNPFPGWDRIQILNPSFNVDSEYQNTPLPAQYLNLGSQSISNSQSVPPPLPPRADIGRNSRLSSYNSPYYSPYSRFSPNMYSTFGGYRTPYSRFGMPPGPDSYNSTFIQLAEESTRPAFESIESVVDIVGSISMMLESTYHAVYSSYNAILGVVDQFSRLKDHLAEVLSFLALLRGLRYLCLKILYLLRLRKDNPSVEAAWKTAESASGNPDFSQFHNDKKSPWPIFMFVGLVIGAPWLMFKLLSRSVSKKPFDRRAWQEKNGYLMCVGNYNFNSNRRGELSFKAGEKLYVAPKRFQVNVPRGWMLACNKDDQVGLIPQNYIKSKVISRKTNPVSKDSPAKLEETVSENLADFPEFGPVKSSAPEFGPVKPSAPEFGPVKPSTPEGEPNTSESTSAGVEQETEDKK